MNMPDLLRKCGMNETAKPEYWIGDTCTAPFANILTEWNPEKDALLFGALLEFIRTHQIGDKCLNKIPNIAIRSTGHPTADEYKAKTHALLNLLLIPERGITLAKAVWEIVK